MKNNVPNLDAMDVDQLVAFWARYHCRSSKRAAELFPNRPKGYIREMNNLANYAINKATAATCRINANYAINKATAATRRIDRKIREALMYERISDDIFNRTMEWARW